MRILTSEEPLYERFLGVEVENLSTILYLRRAFVVAGIAEPNIAVLIFSDYLDDELMHLADEKLECRIRASVHILFYSIMSGEGDRNEAAIIASGVVGKYLLSALDSVWHYHKENGIGQSPEDLACKEKCVNRICSFRFYGNRNKQTATEFFRSCIKLYGCVRNIMDKKEAFAYAYAGLPAFDYLEEIGEMDDYPGLAYMAVIHVSHAITVLEDRQKRNEELKIAMRLFRKAGYEESKMYGDYLDVITYFLGLEVF